MYGEQFYKDEPSGGFTAIVYKGIIVGHMETSTKADVIERIGKEIEFWAR